MEGYLMHIAYAIAARLGGSGIGNIASRAVRAILKANLSFTAFAFGNKMAAAAEFQTYISPSAHPAVEKE